MRHVQEGYEEYLRVSFDEPLSDGERDEVRRVWFAASTHLLAKLAEAVSGRMSDAQAQEMIREVTSELVDYRDRVEARTGCQCGWCEARRVARRSDTPPAPAPTPGDAPCP